ncbi:hypothetical protein EUTSA_v10001931mg [Eutrema salsugineum]|uniref:DUF577 domain-containing protein n=2 Tax=Eutrema salsugineum TaxID=72664 RepID=V4M553_EUTSA|nr:hypothetical protein EUTSA_v10001931mg [Eutrema salsugineum]
MAEGSLSLMLKSRGLLATPSHEGLAIIVDQLYTHKESVEYQTARALYDFCVANFSNCLTLMLLKVYRHASDEVARFRSILLLSDTLTKQRNRGFELALYVLDDIKKLLISCLTMPNPKKPDTKILRIIVSLVAFDAVNHDISGGWDELGDCILSLTSSDPFRAFNVFLDLPPVHGGFIDRFLYKLIEEVHKILSHPEKDKDEDWTLALETAVKLGIRLSDSELRFNLAKEILESVFNSANALVSMGMEGFLQGALEQLVRYLAKEVELCKWSSVQCGFVAEFSCRIAGIGGAATRETAKKINQMVTKLDKYEDNPSFKLSPSRVENQGNGFGDDREMYYELTTKSAFDILRAFLLADHNDRARETAIRRLHDLVCDHDLNLIEIDKLLPLLITCLKDKGMPENTFRILGQVVFHVALEAFSYRNDMWFDLWDYIATETEAEFSKAVYIFQCLTMRLDDKKNSLVLLALKNLVPEMCKRLNPPGELLVDNSSWVLAFTGAFCAVIRLINIPSPVGFVKMIADNMIDSVKELVERKMEVGLVRRAFRDLESIVEKQWDWYQTCEYRFVKGLLWKLYAIEGMKMESKMVLWRINGILERNVNEEFKVLPETKLDWLNQSETTLAN